MSKEKIINLLIFLIILTVMLSVIICRPIGDLDELWNYNFARNFSDGLVPYRDFNILQMPLFSIICGTILKLTVNQLFIMRFLATILGALILFLVYKIFNELKVKRTILIIFIAFFIYILRDILFIDYNWGTLFLTLGLIYLEIKQYRKNGTKDILQYDNIWFEIGVGILAGLTFTLKQTSGILICMVAAGNKLVYVKDLKQFKKFLKIFLYRIIGILVPIVLMLAYLIINNAFIDFINYTIICAKEFIHYAPYGKLFHENIVIKILAILVPLYMFYGTIRYILNEKNKNKERYFLLIYGLAIFILVFPISNKVHFFVGSVPIISAILYEIYYYCYKFYNKKVCNHLTKKIIKYFFIIVDIVIIGTLIYVTVSNFITYFKNQNNYSNLNHYKSIMINPVSEKAIEEVDNYILNSEKQVEFVNAQAVLYKIPLNQYSKYYDMLLGGNLGENGPEKIINQIKEAKNTQYLVLKDKFKLNWQVPISIVDYVKENKEKIGEVALFDIYE